MPAQPFRHKYLENGAIKLGILLLVLTGTVLGPNDHLAGYYELDGHLMRLNPLTPLSAMLLSSLSAGSSGDLVQPRRLLLSTVNAKAALRTGADRQALSPAEAHREGNTRQRHFAGASFCWLVKAGVLTANTSKPVCTP